MTYSQFWDSLIGDLGSTFKRTVKTRMRIVQKMALAGRTRVVGLAIIVVLATFFWETYE
jgi:hypothetical protein